MGSLLLRRGMGRILPRSEPTSVAEGAGNPFVATHVSDKEPTLLLWDDGLLCFLVPTTNDDDDCDDCDDYDDYVLLAAATGAGRRYATTTSCFQILISGRAWACRWTMDCCITVGRSWDQSDSPEVTTDGRISCLFG